jgi:hypothetical protein
VRRTPYRLVLRAPRAILDLRDEFAAGRTLAPAPPRPFGPVQLRVVARLDGAERQELDPPLDPVVRENPSGYRIWFGEVRSPEGGNHALPGGRYALTVESWYYQPLELEVELPPPEDGRFAETPDPFTLNLLPSYGYPFPRAARGTTQLLGSLHGRDGTGQPDALVRSAPAVNDYRTDETGQWMLAFADDQPSGPVDVEIELPERPAVTVPAELRRGAQATLAQTSLRGAVRTEAGYGAATATIGVSGQVDASRSRPDGSWSYYFDPDFAPDPADPSADVTTVDVTATLPDGRTLTQPDVTVRRRASTPGPIFDFSGS